jgi:hypothetical protein
VGAGLSAVPGAKIRDHARQRLLEEHAVTFSRKLQSSTDLSSNAINEITAPGASENSGVSPILSDMTGDAVGFAGRLRVRCPLSLNHSYSTFKLEASLLQRFRTGQAAKGCPKIDANEIRRRDRICFQKPTNDSKRCVLSNV